MGGAPPLVGKVCQLLAPMCMLGAKLVCCVYFVGAKCVFFVAKLRKYIPGCLVDDNLGGVRLRAEGVGGE